MIDFGSFIIAWIMAGIIVIGLICAFAYLPLFWAFIILGALILSIIILIIYIQRT
jgi:hypothetical protein